MKIRILTQNPLSVGFGGVEQQAMAYRKGISMLDANMDIDFFSWSEDCFDILHIIGIHSGVNPYWIDVLQKKGVKVVISSVFYVKPNSIWDFRRPSIYRAFSYIPHHTVNWMKQILHKADIVLPNSLAEKQQIQSVFGVYPEKMIVLYNGVDA